MRYKNRPFLIALGIFAFVFISAIFGMVVFAAPLQASTSRLLAQPVWVATATLSNVEASPNLTCTPTWNLVTGPSPTGDHLFGVDAVSANDIWAVGTIDIDNMPRTLTVHWDGMEWRIIPSQNVGTRDNYLIGVAAIDANDVWAVGYYQPTFGPSQALIEHWDGNQWNVVPSPSTNISDNVLRSVTAVAADDVWAVGVYYGGSGHSRPLVEHWDGNQWSVIPCPNPNPSGTTELWDVSAVSSNDVWAVGFYTNSFGDLTLTFHWDGKLWSVVSSPNYFDSDQNYLLGVDTIATDDVWAVGDGEGQPFTIHWDGNQWTFVPSPNPAPSDNSLWSVTALSINDVWAVGRSRNETLILHWDGMKWAQIASPNQGVYNRLRRVVSVTDDDVWAVGYYSNCLCRDQTLFEHYTLPCLTSTATATPSLTISVTSTNTPTNIPASTSSGTSSITNTSTRTITPTCTATATATATAIVMATTTTTPCAIAFTDVSYADYFYESVCRLYCQGVISGYADHTFRPYQYTTRSQLCKIVALAQGWVIVTPTATATPSFRDVPPSHPFFSYVETAVRHNIISGYSDGNFRPSMNVTRGQLCKVVILAQSWNLICPKTPNFSDVSRDSIFYCFIETAYSHDIISGYGDRTFRPMNSTTRGQICKIVYGAIQR